MPVRLYSLDDLLVQDALRSVVRRVLSDAARNGLPGEHHFKISFKTHAPGVVVPATARCCRRYPDEMAIILQHEFWDLEVNNDGFEVSLNFLACRPERLDDPARFHHRLQRPFGAVRLQARTARRGGKSRPRRRQRPREKRGANPTEAASPAQPATKPSPASKSAEAAAKKTERAREAEPAKVVSIDAFRKK